MIYVTSDLHGCAPEVFRALLARAGFTEEDDLFVLGDVIDRGEHGVELLQWMSEQPNIQMLLGNHEAMLLSCDFLFDTITEESLAALDEEKLGLMSNWLANGAEPTLNGLTALKKRDPELLEGLLDYLRDAPLFDCVEAGGRTFVLVHAGFENFSPERELEDYSPDELLWARPAPDTRYFSNAAVIFGHTPTEYFGSEHKGRMYAGEGWYCIDTGAAAGGTPMLLRLDDMKEFYG